MTATIMGADESAAEDDVREGRVEKGREKGRKDKSKWSETKIQKVRPSTHKNVGLLSFSELSPPEGARKRKLI